MKTPIYLDYMATTPVDPRVAAKMHACLTTDNNFGHASSQHFYGYKAQDAIEQARKQVADLLNTDAKNIIWTSGATEANNLAIKGAAHFYKRQRKHIVTCSTEHKAVLNPCKYLETQGFEVTYLDPEPDGIIDLNKLENVLRKDTLLVSIMQVNNEIGVIQDIAAIGELTRARGIIFHVDAAQSVGKIPIDLEKLKVDLMSFAAHKIYGPKGIGALWMRQKPKLHLEVQLHGGEQEHGLRSGTLPTHQIVGMGEAYQIANEEIKMGLENKRLLQLRQRLWEGIKNLGDIYINGSLEKRIAGNLNVSFGNIDGEVLLSALTDLAVSSTAACTTTVYEPSHVLKALGVKFDLAQSTIRFSVGRFTTEQEIDHAITHINDVVTKLRN